MEADDFKQAINDLPLANRTVVFQKRDADGIVAETTFDVDRIMHDDHYIYLVNDVV